MRTRSPFALAVLALVLGCRREQAPPPANPAPASEPDMAGGPRSAAEFGPPLRWQIDGSTMAEDPSLPVALDRALREYGRLREDVQDHVVVDINGDGQLDAVVLLPAPTVAGAYDVLVLLSVGQSVRVHELGPLVDHAIFSAAVLPIVDGPTLIGVSPRLGSCERGPVWTFLRPTGDLLEQVGRMAIEPYDCAAQPGEIVIVRDDDGEVRGIELHRGASITYYHWDVTLGQFVPGPESA